jgi:hypothetical protein
VRTHPVEKLLEQHCFKSAAGLLQLVRLYVCTVGINRDFMHVTCFDVMPETHFGQNFTSFWKKLSSIYIEIHTNILYLRSNA